MIKAAASRRPSGLNASAKVAAMPPRNVASSLPPATSQRWIAVEIAHRQAAAVGAERQGRLGTAWTGPSSGLRGVRKVSDLTARRRLPDRDAPGGVGEGQLPGVGAEDQAAPIRGLTVAARR